MQLHLAADVPGRRCSPAALTSLEPSRQNYLNHPLQQITDYGIEGPVPKELCDLEALTEYDVGGFLLWVDARRGWCNSVRRGPGWRRACWACARMLQAQRARF